MSCKMKKSMRVVMTHRLRNTVKKQTTSKLKMMVLKRV